LPAILIYRYSI